MIDTRYAIGVALAAAVLTACSTNPTPTVGGSTAAAPTSEVNPAGDIPDNQAFVPYTAPDDSFTMSIPEGWAKTDTPKGVKFSDKFNSITISSRENVAVAPSVESARSTELPALAANTPGYTPGDVKSVDRKSGSVMLITYQDQSAPSAVTGKSVTEAVEQYEFFESGRDVVLTLAAPDGSDNVDPWRTVTDSFAWLP
ncbi:hypothetical protein [Rhodococcus sp. 1168]|uniref:hypothetical protein n=1 Tax=Rhodococcus sp. 1168 TaxID=2018041 RepID=UPI000A0C8E3A|nr:hypothetical protein [Rhodococcus sp. 1168]ORI13508.1 hypothetical protein BJI47_23035 [Rhodococcus sp. 1168]